MAGLEKLRFLEKKTFLGFTGHRRPDTKLRQKRNIPKPRRKSCCANHIMSKLTNHN